MTGIELLIEPLDSGFPFSVACPIPHPARWAPYRGGRPRHQRWSLCNADPV